MTRKCIASIGECMLEFANANSDNYKLAFAGDTYNVAYYCRNSVTREELEVEYVTALGDDPYSHKMLNNWRQAGIGTNYVRQLPGFLPGLYLLYNDKDFERHFYYYRLQAAARHMFDGDDGNKLIKLLEDVDVIYLSGITLAILLPESRKKLFELISVAKAQGITIIFDDNYRSKLWTTPVEAKKEYLKIISFVDIALPSYDDSKLLFHDKSMEDTAKRFRDLGVREVIVKAGEKGYLMMDDDTNEFVKITPAKNLVDTAGAGDSFNGGYLAKRLTGTSMIDASAFGSRLASNVVQYKGAIIPKAVFTSENKA